MKNEEEKAIRVREYLKKAYLQWCQDNGEVRSQADFARWMGIRPSSVSQWMNGLRYPEGENLAKLALALGPGIYDAMMMDHGTTSATQLSEVVATWDTLPAEVRDRVIDILRDALTGKGGTNQGI